MRTGNVYVLVYTTGEFVGIDNNSGGYPFKTKDWRSARLWRTIAEAKEYRKMFSDTYTHGGWKIKEIVWELREGE